MTPEEADYKERWCAAYVRKWGEPFYLCVNPDFKDDPIPPEYYSEFNVKRNTNLKYGTSKYNRPHALRTTTTGTVVYKRKRHFWDKRSIRRLILKFIQEENGEEASPVDRLADTSLIVYVWLESIADLLPDTVNYPVQIVVLIVETLESGDWDSFNEKLLAILWDLVQGEIDKKIKEITNGS
jgi:hypothetical protein